MKKYLFFFLFSCILPLTAYSQFNTSFEGTGQWCTDDSKLVGNDTLDKIRSNAYLKFDYSLKNWDFSAQIESYLPRALLGYPAEFEKINIGTLYARYHNSDLLGLDISGGHLYDQLGSGLVLRTWEDRQLGLNNSLLGGRVALSPINGITLSVLGGKQRIGMGFDLSNGTIYAANLEASIADLLSISDYTLDAGFSFVGRYETPPTETTTRVSVNAPNTVNTYSGRLNFSMHGFYIGGEYVFKGKDVFVTPNVLEPVMNNLYSGQALLINLGYTKKGLGIDINLRRLENMGFYSQRDLTSNDYNRGTLNYLPALTKQYDYALQNLYIYPAQSYLQFGTNVINGQTTLKKAGEIGGQIDLIYEFKKGSFLGGKYGANVAINASYWAGLKTTDNHDGTYSSDFLGFGERLYNDFGIEIRKRYTKDLSFIFMYLNQYYNEGYIKGEIGEVNTHTIAAEATYKFKKSQSVRFEAQHQWADALDKNWVGGMLEYNLNYNWSFFVSDMYNYGNDVERIHYYNAGLSFVQNATRVALSYGRQRGGLMCAGGVCRMVSESAGLTLNITTSF